MKKSFHLSVFGILIFKLFVFLCIIFLGLFVFHIENTGFYYCLVALFALSICWLSILKSKRLPESLQLVLQIFLDITLENILIQYSGGLESPLIFLIILDLFLGAYILPRKTMFILACYVSAFYAIFSTLAYLQFLPKFLAVQKDIIPSQDVYFYYVVYMRVFIFLMMGYLASMLSGRFFSQKEKLRQMQNLTELIVFQMGSGLVTVNEKDEIIYSNKAASNILGLNNDELLGKNWKSLFIEEMIPSNELLKQMYNLDGVELKILTRDKKEKFLNLIISDLRDDVENIAGKTLVFRDLTVFKEMEKLQIEQKKLKTLGELAAALAHEIKNPLASICGSLEVLKESNPFGTSHSQKLVNVIFKESERLSRTLQEYLTFSGDIPLKRNYHDIKELIEEIILIIRNHTDVRPEINLLIKKDENDESSFWAFVDEDLFKQMIFNLVLNGVQAISGPGTVAISLSNEWEEGTLFIKIRINDTGIGISEQVRREIFKPFYTTRSKGIGLGLNVCMKIASQHGWKFFLDSGYSDGTTFTVSIPAKEF